MENIDKYIGIKFKFDITDCDITKYNNCLGLAKLFYADHGYSQTFDDGEPWETNSRNNYLKRMLSYFEKSFKKENSIDELEFGDIVLLYTGAHVGIYLGDNKILAFERECEENVSVTKIFTVDEIGKENIKFYYKR